MLEEPHRSQPPLASMRPRRRSRRLCVALRTQARRNSLSLANSVSTFDPLNGASTRQRRRQAEGASMKYAILPAALAAALLGACASSSDKVAATYVSPIQ